MIWSAVRKNPVLKDLKGFDGRARIYNVDCPDKGGYGIPSRISFEFCSWYMKKDGMPARKLKVNPEYWNKHLPKSEIQFIYFRSGQ